MGGDTAAAGEPRSGDSASSGPWVVLQIPAWAGRWPASAQVSLALSLSLYCFLGVAYLVDILMLATERITSKEVETEIKISGRTRTIRSQLWNRTVANLTLMALGSSAPQILLACVELVSRHGLAGELGSSTILGSAAFNLLCVTAVCIVAVPPTHTRKVADVSVLWVTAGFSVFAYMWLALVLLVRTPGEVEVWEGVVTVALLPALVVAASATDVGAFNEASAHVSKLIGAYDAESGQMVNKEVLEHVRDDLIAQAADVSDENVKHVAVSVARYSAHQNTRAYYRMQTMQAAVGRRPQPPRLRFTRQMEDRSSQRAPPLVPGGTVSVSFSSPSCCVLENLGKVELRVTLDYSTADAAETTRVSVLYRTHDGTAAAGHDYVGVEYGKLSFQEGETSKLVEVGIVDDDVVEDDEYFDVELFDARSETSLPLDPPTCVLGPYATSRVTIIDDDLPGVLTAARDSVKAKPSDDAATVVLDRHSGVSGRVSCSYYTVDGTAKSGVDYVAQSGTLVFQAGETTQEVRVPLLKSVMYRGRQPRTFRVVFADATGGARFETLVHTSGGADADKHPLSLAEEEVDSVATLVAIDSDTVRRRQRRMTEMLNLSVYTAAFATASWTEQFRVALSGPGSRHPDSSWDGRGGESGAAAWATHAVSLPWKLLAACVPPTEVLGGKLCFLVSLVLIGGIMVVVQDLARTLAYCLHVSEMVVGVTLVALGTSVPDMFASRRAAIEDEDAGACFVNIAGRNSVNVYLGLGLPWLGGAIYWKHVGATSEWRAMYPAFAQQHPAGAFVVPPADLGYRCVVGLCMYLATITSTFAALALRRTLYGGELGGPRWPAMTAATFLLCLWLTYIFLVTERAGVDIGLHT